MAFYQFLAIFPSLAAFLAATAHGGDHMQNVLRGIFVQVLPEQVAELLQDAMGQIAQRGIAGWRLVVVCGGAAWALLNTTWAMLYGLNRAYEVQERRSLWELGVTIVALTATMALAASAAMFLILAGVRSEGDGTSLHAIEWLVLAMTLWLSFALLYRFAPNVRDHEWRWSAPGALAALILWIGATFSARIYFERIDDYSRSYGGLNGVAMLLLWLYVTNGAILIGGEMNSEIQKAQTGGEASAQDRSGSA
jgi:membrane protein